VVRAVDQISLVKIDIEGAEYEIVRETRPEIWQKIPAISLELHTDPQHTMTNAQFLDQMKSLGYSVESEKVCSYFLKR
jgi:hypothetical protein